MHRDEFFRRRRTRRSILLVCGDRRTVAAPRHGAAAPQRHGHQTTPCRKPWRARVCRSTSPPAHPITGLPPILSLNLHMSLSACLWRVETTVWNFCMSVFSRQIRNIWIKTTVALVRKRTLQEAESRYPPFPPFFLGNFFLAKTGGVNLFCNNKRGSLISPELLNGGRRGKVSWR